MTSERWEHTPNTWREVKPSPPVITLHTNDAQAITGVIVNNALEWVSARVGYDKSKVVECLNGGDVAAQRELKLALARYLAEYLGFLDEDVKAVYVADHIENYRAALNEEPPRWIVHLVVFADPKTAALTLLVSALNRALTSVLRESIECAKVARFLEVQVVNSADLENLARYAALLTAPSYRPMRIWQREPHGASAQDRGAPSCESNVVTVKSNGEKYPG